MPPYVPCDAYVRNAVDSPSVKSACRRFGARQLPAGFPFLVAGRTGAVIEPVLSFIAAKYLVRQLPGRPEHLRNSSNTREAMIRDLKDFFDFLDAEQLSVDQLSVMAVNSYGATMLGTRSPATGQSYAFATAVRRISNIRTFASWLQDEGRLQHRLDLSQISPSSATTAARPALVGSGISLRGLGNVSDVINVMTKAEASALLQALGPMPSARNERNDTRYARDRLAASLALNVGLRRQEVASLPLQEAERAVAEAARREPFGMCTMRIFGKGRKWRRVNVPSWLLAEIDLYIQGERAEAVVAGRRLYGHAYVSATTLFLGHPTATTSRGLPITGGTLYEAFHRPQQQLIAAGSLGQHFRFHDLRHTYAVWTWLMRRKAKDPQPSKYIQAQLGHSSRETTERIYLATVSMYEPLVHDVLVVRIEDMANA
jgi:integrase